MSNPREFRGIMHRKMAELNSWTKQGHEEPLDPQLPILDSQHHLWDDERGRYMLDEILEDVNTGHNVIATLYMQAGTMYRADGPIEMQPIGEVEVANGIAAMSASGNYGKTRICAGIVAHADLTLGNRVQPVLEALIAAGNGRLRGVRHNTTWDSGNAMRFGKRQPPRYLALDPAFRQGLACLRPLGLSFDAFMFYPQLPDLMDLLRAFPDTPVILNHVGGILGIPPHDGDRQAVFNVWRDHMRELSQFPNLSVKLGGLGVLFCGWDFHFRDLPPSSEELATAWRPYIETCIESFGADRCMMESNFPSDKQSCGYGVLWNAMKRITQGCSAAEKAALYRDTAARIYRLSI